MGEFSVRVRRYFQLMSGFQKLYSTLIVACLLSATASGSCIVEMTNLKSGQQSPAALRCTNDRPQSLHGPNRRGSRRISRTSENPGPDESLDESLPYLLGLVIEAVASPALTALAAFCMMTESSHAVDHGNRSHSEVVVTAMAIDPDSVFRFDPLMRVKGSAVQLVSGEHRTSPWGNGQIVVADPADFPRIRAFDVDDRESLWDNMRPNLIGEAIPDEWDFSNLINTDRPDFTDATFSAGKGVTIIESGYTFRKSSSDDLSVTRRQLPEVLTRIGITDEFEIRLKWNGYVMTDIADSSTGLSTSNFGGDDLQLGFKYEILQQHDWRPMVTFVGTGVLPTGTNGVSANAVQPSANVVYGWGFRRWLYLKMSTGADFVKSRDATRIIDGSVAEGPLSLLAEDTSTQWHQSASLLTQISKRIGSFVEWFSFFSDNAADNRATHFVDAGLFIYATPNIQLDVRIGGRLSNRTDTVFTGAGFSVRF